MKVRDTDFDPRLFCALIVTSRLRIVREGVPEITPLFVLSVSPFGRVPETSEYVTESPVMEGEAENGSSLSIE